MTLAHGRGPTLNNILHPSTPHDREQRSFTEPYRRFMKMQDGIIEGYNAQEAMGVDHQVIVALELTNHVATCTNSSRYWSQSGP
jgi:hypothetical protein